MSGILMLILRLLMAALLYGFLGWALVTIWRDLRSQEEMLAAPFIPALTLTPLEGGEENAQTFSAPEVIIGRSASSDYEISDETVSVRHARLSYHHNQWWVEDLRSTNGSYLNDERINVPTVIINSDELRVGQISLLVSINETR